MTIAVTSGKGGVGKTNVSINLGVALARLRHRVAVLDADFGLGNVDVMLGLAPTGTSATCSPARRRSTRFSSPARTACRSSRPDSGMQQLTALSPTPVGAAGDAPSSTSPTPSTT